MSKLKEKYPNFLLQIIGFGEDYYLKRIDELINNHNLRKNIEIVGYVDNKDLVSYINACDVFVTPSRWEGFWHANIGSNG
jgi:glycosyltransferase involved in cell wall biosynthesis